MPAAWYWPQSQIENGDSRPICHTSERSPNVRAAASGFDSRRRIAKTAREATRKPARKRPFGRPSGYVAHIGAAISDANLVQPDSAVSAPRAPGLLTSQNPQTRNAGTRASLVLELDAYWVKGYAVQANASVAARRIPPKRSPTRTRPASVNRSKRIAVKWAAGSSSHRPDQPNSQ